MPSIIEILALAVGIGNFLGLLYLILFRFAKTESRVEVLWAFLLRNAASEAITAGLLRKKSPLALNLDALKSHKFLLDRIKEFYVDGGHSLPDLDLIVKMEKVFGKQLQRLAMDHGLTDGGCLMAAAFSVRPEMPVFAPFDEYRGLTMGQAEE